MNLRRILKVLFGSFLSQGVTVIWQLLIPPFFLALLWPWRSMASGSR